MPARKAKSNVRSSREERGTLSALRPLSSRSATSRFRLNVLKLEHPSLCLEGASVSTTTSFRLE